MFDKLKKDLYFLKHQMLFSKGIKEEKIVLFDDDFYEAMSHTYVSCLPVSIEIKYLKPSYGMRGRCYDRSLYMFFCFDDALLVRGDSKELEFLYGKNHAGHGWIEIGDYVYDPTLLMKFDKDLYYKIYEITNVTKVNRDKYREINDNFYDDIKNTSLEDFKVGGKRRMDLLIVAPITKSLASVSKNEDFIRELDLYLDSVQYDERMIQSEMDSMINGCLVKKKTSK